VTTSLKGETAFSINKKESQKLIDNLNIARKDINSHIENVLRDAKSLSGYVEQQPDRHPVFRGRYRRDGYSIELHAIHGEGDYIIPLLLFIPSSANNLPAVIYLNPQSKAADAGKGGKIEQLVKGGYVVAAPDVIGTGETFDDYFGPMYESGLIGRSIPGIQAGDIGRVIGFLKSRSEVNSGKISGIAIDEMCPTLIHAAAFNNEIRSIALYGSLISYRTLVMNEFYEVRPRAAISEKTRFYPGGVSYMNYTVTGALKSYDLPDLIGCIAPRKVALINATDHLKKPADPDLVNEDMAFPKAAFASKNASGNLKITSDNTDLKQIAGWCFE
jgi:ankyrin repeat protein